ncbi:MAG: LysE family translocator [Thiohalomonadales bacterium]
MNTELYFSFLLISTLFIIIPGPNVWLIISTSLVSGRKQGLKTVLGTSSAMSIQLLMAAFGSAWFLTLLSDSLLGLKWIGVIYLAILGIQQILSAVKSSTSETQAPSGNGSYWLGFTVSLTNPKTILFFMAFLPQFIDESQSIGYQMTILSLSFLLLATFFDSIYAFLASRLSQHLKYPRRIKFCSGSILLSLSALLASSRQS